MKTINFINKLNKKGGNMKRITTILVGILITANCFAQTQDTIKGTLTNATPMFDMNFGEVVPYVDVFYKFTPTKKTTVAIELINDNGVKNFYLSDSTNPTLRLIPLEGEKGDNNEGENEGEDQGYSSQVIDTVIKTYDCQAGKTYIIRVTDPNDLGGDFTLSLKDVTPCKVDTAVGSGTGSIILTDSVFIRNTECVVSATPEICYRFVNWTENSIVVSDDIEYAFNVDSNRRLVANFELRKYEIYSSVENGTIDSTQTVNCGDSRTFKFFPTDDCYELDKLYVDGEETTAVGNTAYTFTNVMEGYTIFAAFKKKQYNITSSTLNNLHGYVLPVGDTTVFCGDSITYYFTANTLPYECELAYVLDNGDTVPANKIINNTYTLYDVRDTHNIQAVFKEITYTISATADVNGVIVPQGNIEVRKGEGQSFTIVRKDECYTIDSVFINGVYDYSATLQVLSGSYAFAYTDLSPKSIFIKTIQSTRTITAKVNNYGTVKYNGQPFSTGNTITVGCGTFNIFEMLPLDSTYEAEVLLCDGNGFNCDTITSQVNGNLLTVSVTENSMLIVNFKKKPHRIYVTTYGNHGQVFPNNSPVIVEYGKDTTFQFLPDGNNYTVDSVFLDGKRIDTSQIIKQYTLIPEKIVHRLDVHFGVKITHCVTASAGTHGLINPSVKCVENRESVTFCFTPEEKYQIGSVTIDNTNIVDIDSCYTFVPIANHTIHVTFVRVTTGIMELEDLLIMLYPNPAYSQITLENSKVSVGDKIEIFDINGKLIQTTVITDMQRTVIDVSDLSQGTYIVKVGVYIGKFIKL